jgi:hypothetical protein
LDADAAHNAASECVSESESSLNSGLDTDGSEDSDLDKAEDQIEPHTSGLEINIDTPVQVDEQLESASNPPIGMSFVDFLAVI